MSSYTEDEAAAERAYEANRPYCSEGCGNEAEVLGEDGRYYCGNADREAVCGEREWEESPEGQSWLAKWKPYGR